MKFSSKKLAQTVTLLCEAKQIQHVVISPGSRNAPLSISFTENPYFNCYSIVDERCAAFFALGMAQQLKKPVALVCTSGSALLNYYPAIAEAFYSDIPLVVLSADRPSHLVEIGDGQTIQQENVYGNHSIYNANCSDDATEQKYNETEINIALNLAIELNGPVHINLPLSEPLYDIVEDVSVQPQHVPVLKKQTTVDAITSEIFTTIQTLWNTKSRKIILVGVLEPDSIEQQYIEYLAKDPSVLVLTETTSNLHHPSFFPSIDQLIAPLDDQGFKKLQPELLITIGGMIVSKKIKAFLRTYQPLAHYHVDIKKAYDTYFCLTEHIKMTPNVFFERILNNAVSLESTYFEEWNSIKKHRLKAHDAYVSAMPFSDFKVFDEVLNALKGDYMLQLANSTTIRYAQLFDIPSSITVFCNRGTSGIDGSTSTAIGAAVISKKPTVLITGDLSFLYDSNGLWNRYIPSNFKIIVLNNAGGGIFRILPKAKEVSNFESFFETQHDHSAMQLANMYHFEYFKAEDAVSLTEKLGQFLKISEAPAILEVCTPREKNDAILLDYFKALR